ncbi:unnamed protein product [Haemonchus placei]|uniref:Ubiquitin-like domain-containing protein n=1 Tax=Haemonchus placei TaxID=6290 RepID=A0A0N4WBC0_HAEPC|nr:unnamed protein product [Haemonchus placei]
MLTHLEIVLRIKVDVNKTPSKFMAQEGAVSDSVELTVRCAFQTSKDIRVVCPPNWTIRTLKEHLHQAVTSQRLIFSGACLTDDMVIKEIMDQRNSANASTTAPQAPSDPTPAWATNYYEWYQRYYGSVGPSPEHVARLQQYSGYYAAYMSQWQGYQNFMMGNMGYGALLAQGMGSSEPSMNAMHIPVAQVVNHGGPANAAAPPQDDVNVAAAAEQVPAEPNGIAVQGGGRDVLDMVYRVFRVLLFLSAVLLYSSLERFLAVITIALFIFFIQLRRNQQRQARVAQPAAPNVNNNNTGEQPHDAVENAQPIYVAPTPPSTLQIFFATCYSFVTSFFTSLVPDHPVPVDLN